ncbi:hypothetical protein [Roseibium sp. SCP14]|uniref:hypothetical protein n=1 Tax=Roseibium sp. SCP14 TaxID=3141375 RepID=UPI00333552F9
MSEAEKEKIKHFSSFINIVAAGAIVAGSLVPILNVWYGILDPSMNGGGSLDGVAATQAILIYLTGFVICFVLQLLGGLKLSEIE